MKAIIKALACAAFLAATPAAATNILDNPGFETGSLSPWFVGTDYSNGTGTDWAVTDADSHSGTYSVEDSGNIELRQNFTGVLGSSIDQVSFWARHPGGNDPLAYDFYYSDNTFAEFSLDNLTGSDWNFIDATLHLDPTKTLTGFSIFGFSGGSNGDVTRADDFVIDVAGAVPEPATWAMMILGFGFTGLAMRRRRRVSAALA